MPVFIPPLAARDRAVLLYATGLSTAEVADELGVSPGTVRRWRRTADFRVQLERVRLRLLDQATDAVARGVQR